MPEGVDQERGAASAPGAAARRGGGSDRQELLTKRLSATATSANPRRSGECGDLAAQHPLCDSGPHSSYCP